MSLDISRIRAIFFDLDGTLSDTDDYFVNRLYSLLRISRFLLPENQIRVTARRLVMSFESPVNRFIGMLDQLGLDRLLGFFENVHVLPKQIQTKYQIIPGVNKTLEQLSSKFPMAIVSARGKQSTLRFLETHDLNRLFCSITTAQTCKRTKPHPEPVLWTAQQIGVPPDQCLMVGDTTVDIIAGRAANTQTLGVLCGFGEEKELTEAGADMILPSTADLAAIFFIASE